MSEPTPRRFRFSLGLLMLWALLSAALMMLSLKYTEFGGRRPTLILPTEDPLSLRNEELSYRGWPTPAILERNQNVVVRSEILFVGLCLDFWVCVFASFHLCNVIDLIWRRSRAVPTTVKNE